MTTMTVPTTAAQTPRMNPFTFMLAQAAAEVEEAIARLDVEAIVLRAASEALEQSGADAVTLGVFALYYDAEMSHR
jgi:hypothetical protein